MDDHGRLPFFGAPPPRQPQPASSSATLRGKRVVLSTPDGFVYDMRAVSEPTRRLEGPMVEVATEEDYFRWMFGDERPETQVYPVELVWVE